MADRRRFLHDSILASSLLLAADRSARAQAAPNSATIAPRVVSTWDFGVAANQAAWAVLAKDGARARCGRGRRARSRSRSQESQRRPRGLSGSRRSRVARCIDHGRARQLRRRRGDRAHRASDLGRAARHGENAARAAGRRRRDAVRDRAGICARGIADARIGESVARMAQDRELQTRRKQ